MSALQLVEPTRVEQTRVVTNDITIEAYHANDLISKSMLLAFERLGPRGYFIKYLLDGREPEEKTEAMIVGQCFEDAVCGLGGWRVRPKTIHVQKRKGKEKLVDEHGNPIMHDVPLKLNTVDGIAWRAELEEREPGVVLLPAAASGLFTYGLQAFQENEEAQDLMGEEQVTFQSHWPGLPGIQGRPDWYLPGGSIHAPHAGPVFPDLKTVHDFGAQAEDGSFPLLDKTVRQFGYHVQAAMLRLASGGDMTNHPLIFVEKTFPNRCLVYWMNETWVRVGLRKAHSLLDRLAAQYQGQRWPSVESESLIGEPPRWLIEEE